MTRLTAELLARCLDEVRSGRMGVEECLAAHPDIGEELRSTLEVALAIAPPPPVVPDPHLATLGRARLIAEINATKMAVTETPVARLRRLVSVGGYWPVPLFSRRMRMPAIILAIVIALTTATGGGAVYAAQGSLPGDTLYPVKTAAEQVQLVLAVTDQAKAQTYLDLTEKRLVEVQQATQSNRPAAAAAASEELTQEINQANQNLASAAASGQDVSGLSGRFTDNLTHIQTTLSGEQAVAPASALGALTQASAAVTNGLTVASSHAARTARVNPTAQTTSTVTGIADDAVLATTTGTSEATTTETVVATETTGTPNATVSPTAVSLDPLLAATQQLQADSLVPGESYQGLTAKLSAAQNAIQNGQNDAASNILNAYVGQLNALARSGHISPSNYATLFGMYQNLVTNLGGSPRQPVNSASATPSAVTTETTTVTPGTTPSVEPTDSEGTGTPAEGDRPDKQPTQAANPSTVPTRETDPTGDATESPKPTPHGVPSRVSPTVVSSEPTDTSSNGEPTRVVPTAVPTSPAHPTRRPEPTEVKPTVVPTQRPAPTVAPTERPQPTEAPTQRPQPTQPAPNGGSSDGSHGKSGR